MNLNDAIAIARFIIVILATGIFAYIYFRKLRFHGFLSLAIAFAASTVTLVLVELGFITATEFVYEVLLLLVSMAYLVSAILIYMAIIEYNENGEAKTPNRRQKLVLPNKIEDKIKKQSVV